MTWKGVGTMNCFRPESICHPEIHSTHRLYALFGGFLLRWIKRRLYTVSIRTGGVLCYTMPSRCRTSHTITGRCRPWTNVSFTVEAGEVFGFLGPNGAGKTTTLRILTGQLRPSSGQARVAGCDVVNEREQLKPRIGVVFERQNLYERLSARENLAFSAGLYGAPRKNIDEVLASGRAGRSAPAIP